MEEWEGDPVAVAREVSRWDSSYSCSNKEGPWKGVLYWLKQRKGKGERAAVYVWGPLDHPLAAAKDRGLHLGSKFWEDDCFIAPSRQMYGEWLC